MQNNSSQLIRDLEAILQDSELPDSREASITLGSYGDMVPLSILRRHFSEVKVQFITSDKSYAFVGCKLAGNNWLTFQARVAISELERIEEITEKFVIPTPQLVPIPIIEDSMEDELKPLVLSDVSEDEVPEEQEGKEESTPHNTEETVSEEETPQKEENAPATEQQDTTETQVV